MTEDDRVTCETCLHCSIGKKRCLEYDLATDINLPRRCVMYAPLGSQADQRFGRQRWPQLQKQIELARGEDREFFRNQKRKAFPKSPDSKPGG